MFPFYRTPEKNITVINNKRQISYPSHIHDSIEILYVHRGMQQVIIENKLYEVSAGNVIVIFPSLTHELSRDRSIPKYNNNADTICLMCHSHLIYLMFPNIFKKIPADPLVTNISKEVENAFLNLSLEKSYLSINGWAYIILDKLFSDMNFIDCSIVENISTVKQVVDFIYMNFKKPIDLNTISNELNISQSHLSHIFADKINLNFRTYLGLVRCKYAAIMMKSTDWDLKKNAIESGFDSLRSFNRIFKLIYGLTPTEFKNKKIM